MAAEGSDYARTEAVVYESLVKSLKMVNGMQERQTKVQDIMARKPGASKLTEQENGRIELGVAHRSQPMNSSPEVLQLHGIAAHRHCHCKVMKPSNV